MNSARTKRAVAFAGVVVVTVAAAGMANAAHPFTDLRPGAFYVEAVDWAFNNGITTGTSPTEFSPDAPVTRGQNVTFNFRYDENIVQPALADRYTKAEVDAAIAAAAPQLLTATVPEGAASAFTTSGAFATIPGMELEVVVPPGGWRALITFSGKSICVQDPLDSTFCAVQAVVDPGAAVACLDTPLPLGCASPGLVVFDSVQHGANSTDARGWGAHSHQWTHELTEGTHTIEMQYAVEQAAGAFSLDTRMLSVQLYPV